MRTPPCFYKKTAPGNRGRLDYRRGLRNRWSTRLTTKLTVAPTAARIAVFSSSSVPIWGRALSIVPAAVPSRRSWRISRLRTVALRSGCTKRLARLRLEALPDAQRQAHVFRCGNHFRRQPYRRGNDQLAGQLQPPPQRYPPRCGGLPTLRLGGRGIR